MINERITRTPKVFNPPKEKNTFRYSKTTWILSFILLIVIALFYLIFSSPLFSIKKINFIGIAPLGIKDYFSEYEGKNIFRINTEDKENELLKKTPEIVDVKIYKGIPNTLKVEFKERNAQIIWRSQNHDYLVDENATIYKEVELNENPSLPLVIDNKNVPIELAKPVANASFVGFVKNAEKQIENKGLSVKNSEVNETTFQLDLITIEGIKIIFDTVRPVSDQTEAFDKVFSEHKNDIKEYVDLRVEGWVYYK